MHAPAPASVPVPAAQPEAAAIQPPAVAGEEIQVSRTLVKSQPEIEEIISSHPRFATEGMEVSMAERGFGTMVTISAGPSAGLTEEQLAEALADLSEPQRRPFTNT